MNTKKKFYTELAYLVGLVCLAGGIALMEAVDFGVSMEVAPPYLIYLKVSEMFAGFTFGMSEFIWQTFLIVIMVLVIRKFKISYLFSFLTAGIYAVILDMFIRVIAQLELQSLAVRIICFIAAMLLCEMGISLLFHTYIPQLVYELFVQEVSAGLKIDIYKFKTGFDCVSCVIGIVLSFLFFGFGQFEGVKIGTVIGACLNGWMIHNFSVFFEKTWIFEDRFQNVLNAGGSSNE